MRTPFERSRVMAYVTGVVLLIACFVAVPLQIAGHPGFGKVVWTMHGWLYLIYLFAAVHLALTRRWRVTRILLVLIAGTIPFMSFVMERRVSADEQPSPLR